VDTGIDKRKAATEFLSILEEIRILQSKKMGKEMLYLNARLYELLTK